MAIVCIGEVVLDFVSHDKENNLLDSACFTKNVGGAPANVAKTIGQLGGNGVICGKIGNDLLGKFLEKNLLESNVNCSFLVKDSKASSTFSYITFEENGFKNESFIRGADKNLTICDIDLEKLIENDIFHFGSATAFLDGSLKETYFRLLDFAVNNQKIISFSPNYSHEFWKYNKETFINNSIFFIKHTDILRISEEELYLLTDIHCLNTAVIFLHKIGAKLIIVTLKNNGTLISNGYYQEVINNSNSSFDKNINASDIFTGSFLHYINESQKDIKDFELMKTCVKKSNEIVKKIGKKFNLSKKTNIS